MLNKLAQFIQSFMQKENKNAPIAAPPFVSKAHVQEDGALLTPGEIKKVTNYFAKNPQALTLTH